MFTISKTPATMTTLTTMGWSYLRRLNDDRPVVVVPAALMAEEDLRCPALVTSSSRSYYPLRNLFYNAPPLVDLPVVRWDRNFVLLKPGRCHHSRHLNEVGRRRQAQWVRRRSQARQDLLLLPLPPSPPHHANAPPHPRLCSLTSERKS